MSGATRQTISQTITTVRHVAGTFGRNRTNPPNLGHLREFVEASEGLPDDTPVSIGRLDDGGRYSYTFSLRIVEPIDDANPSEEPSA